MNRPADITALYNSLFQLESGQKKEAVYPIHKKLTYDNNLTEIYEYLITTLNIQNKKILDAGCGVGFGSFLMASRGAKKVTGISVSDLEIARANSVKAQNKVDNIEFRKAGFEETEKNSYDIIFCVESLKHAPDFDKALHALLQGLTKTGMLCIVDDFFTGPENKYVRGMAQNWHLNYILRKEQLESLSGYSTDSIDLMPFVPQKSKLLLRLKMLFFTFFKRKSPFRKLFYGGLQLDYVYAQQKMQYALVIIKKNS